MQTVNCSSFLQETQAALTSPPQFKSIIMRIILCTASPASNTWIKRELKPFVCTSEASTIFSFLRVQTRHILSRYNYNWKWKNKALPLHGYNWKLNKTEYKHVMNVPKKVNFNIKQPRFQGSLPPGLSVRKKLQNPGNEVDFLVALTSWSKRRF